MSFNGFEKVLAFNFWMEKKECLIRTMQCFKAPHWLLCLYLQKPKVAWTKTLLLHAKCRGFLHDWLHERFRTLLQVHSTEEFIFFWHISSHVFVAFCCFFPSNLTDIHRNKKVGVDNKKALEHFSFWWKILPKSAKNYPVA